jgi:outer membrane protein
MKNLSLLLNLVLVVAVGVLFYLQFAGKGNSRAAGKSGAKDSVAMAKEFRIAYFVMDSIEKNYAYYSDAQSDLKSKEQSARDEMEGMRRRAQSRLEQLQAKGPTMSQSEQEAAQREVGKMQNDIASREQSLQQELMTMTENLRKKINEKITNVLTEYNRTHGYAYIITDRPDFTYYRDTIYDITAELLKGLNEDYKSGKK